MGNAPGDWHDLWGLVGESLLGGVHHALNNRVAALSAIAQVLRVGMPDATPLVSSLGSEVNRLEETVAMLSLLRRARTRRPEPVQLPELVVSLVPILGQHNDLKEIAFVPAPTADVLPVWAERDLLTRVLLTLLVAVGLEAEWGGWRRVRISYQGDEATVTVRIACERGENGGMSPDPSVARLDARGTDEAARAMGGEVEAKGGGREETSYELRLPSLLAARKAAGGG